jgi:hypothetical protein
MTEAIAITLIIVAGVVALGVALVFFAYKSIIDQRDREYFTALIAEPSRDVTISADGIKHADIHRLANEQLRRM